MISDWSIINTMYYDNDIFNCFIASLYKESVTINLMNDILVIVKHHVMFYFIELSDLL